MYDMYPAPADWHTMDERVAHRTARRSPDTDRGTARHARPGTHGQEPNETRDSRTDAQH